MVSNRIQFNSSQFLTPFIAPLVRAASTPFVGTFPIKAMSWKELSVFSSKSLRKQSQILIPVNLFSRSLSLFRQWTDDALKNVCIEAQIQEVRNVVDKHSVWKLANEILMFGIW